MLCLAVSIAPASLWNGIDVVDFLHVSGRGGPQDLKGIWSEPLNAQTNTLCSLETDDPKLRCPAACAKTHTVSKKRVRHAIHKMSDAEWQKVVDAMRILRTVKTKDGRLKYGPEYRDMDYHIVRHVLGTLPGLDNVSR